ncbi:MAG: FkbM family methyltransferase [Armatimonadetes bacterium]|nr:FkbM family methyltransferase [Armatimonadota bacterium]MDW8122403.1 FkbM family methyltransferase [Armatimonadota bacterium]
MTVISRLRLWMKYLYEEIRRNGIRGTFRTVRLKLRQMWLIPKTLRNNQCLLHTTTLLGYDLLVDSNDAGIGKELRRYGVHEPALISVLPLFVHEGDTVLDIGANIGYYAVFLSRLIGENGVIVCVEPHPNNFDILLRNLQLNRVKNAIALPLAVSNRKGQAELFVSSWSNWHSLLETVTPRASRIPVTTTTIDDLAQQVNRPVNLIRMDIEGYEFLALEGGRRTLERDKPTLVVEIHPNLQASSDIIAQHLQFLSSLGYESEFLIFRPEEEFGRKARLWRLSLAEIIANKLLLEGPATLLLILVAKEKSVTARARNLRQRSLSGEELVGPQPHKTG